MRRALKVLLAALCIPAPVLAQASSELRTGFMQCGQTLITARSECYDTREYCTSETLSFRATARSIVPLHRTYRVHQVSGRKLKVLDYHAQSWACVPGKFGGRYLVVVMVRVGGASCTECEYSRLYDLNGRLIATDLAFDAQGRARDNETGREMMRKVLGGPGRHAFADVYR